MGSPDDLANFLQPNSPRGNELQSRIINSATASLDLLTRKAPEIKRAQLIRLEELPIQEQAEVFRGVARSVDDPEQFLLEVALARKLLDRTYKNRGDPYFVDPLVNLVEKGHKVVVMHEVAQGGVSRHGARFLQELQETSGITVVNLNDPDIKNLGVDFDKGGTILFRGQPKPGSGEKAGMEGLMELYFQPDHPAFRRGDEANKVVGELMTDEYEIRMTTGVVSAPVRPDEGEKLTLDNGLEVYATDIRFIAIVGMDEAQFLSRGERELYMHRQVRVWADGGWHKGRIAEFSKRNMVGVRLEDQLSEPDRYLGGYGIGVSANSPSLDLSDPNSPEKAHPQEGYSHIKGGVCVRIKNRFGDEVYGVIDGVSPGTKQFRVNGEGGAWEMVSFDGKYEIIDTPENPPLNEWLKVGNRFKVLDPERGVDVIFEVKGTDRARDLLIGQWISSVRPPSRNQIETFSRMGVELLGSPNEILEKYPYLKENFRQRWIHPKIKFMHDGRELEGELLSAQTLPAFVEVIIERNPKPKARSINDNVDYFHRYFVPVEDLRGLVED